MTPMWTNILRGWAIALIGFVARTALGGTTFTNNNVIFMPAAPNSSGTSNPYPLTIPVAGMPGTVTKVTVTIKDFRHHFPADVDMLLVAPGGQKMIVWSDVGGTASTCGTVCDNGANAGTTGVTITLDDAAASGMPNGPLSSGTFKPTNLADAQDIFTSPAPPGSYVDPFTGGTFATAFNGANPNGNWSLYVMDDVTGDSGRIAGGWSITITSGAAVDVSAEKTGPASANAGNNLTYTLTMKNNSGIAASNVVLSDTAPPNTTFLSATQISGTPSSLAVVGTTFQATIASLPAGGMAVFQATFALNSSTPNGTIISNTATVDSSHPDGTTGNNSATAMTSVTTSADLQITQGGPASANAGTQVIYNLTLSNFGPSDAKNVELVNTIPAGSIPVVFAQNTGPAFGLSVNGNQFKAIAGTFAAGATATFQMTVSMPGNTAAGTQITNMAALTSDTADSITNNNSASVTTTIANVMISEFRFRGPGGTSDEFVELYNASDTARTVQSASGGWAIVASDGTVRGLIPNGTVIPARGHFLCVNSAAYSLTGYPGGIVNNAVGDVTYTTGIADNGGVALFNAQNSFTANTLLDAAGFSSVVDTLYREGTGLGVPVGSNVQHSFVRKFNTATGVPQDTNNNSADLELIAVNGNGTLANAELGGPGPENSSAPISRGNTIPPGLIEPNAGGMVTPNEQRAGSGDSGNIFLRRRFTNNTGTTITRLRFRIVEMTTMNSPIAMASQADLRLDSAADTSITTSLGSLTVKGATLEQPPAQVIGGGQNSSATVALPPGGLPAGGTIDVQFLFNVVKAGSYVLGMNVESIPAGGSTFLLSGNTEEAISTTLANISTRLRVETGDNVLIGGFIVTGTQPKNVILRAIGPSLSLPTQLANPTLELYSGSTLIASNDDWKNQPDADRQAVIDSTIPPINDLEAALVRTLPANNSAYTAIVRGVNDGTGIGVVEAYDLDTGSSSKLANIATRGFVQINDDVLIAGTIVVGQATQKVLIRAIGPSLPFGGTLADPTLELRNQNGALLQANDNWVDSPDKQAIINTTIPPTNDFESAIIATLGANASGYTAIVRGVNDTTGIAVVEIYALQ